MVRSCGSNDGSYSWTRGFRKVTVNCEDGSGSGCKQESFSNTWSSGSYTNGNIIIHDNAGNMTACGVPIFLDNTSPSIYGGYCTGERNGQVIIGVKFNDSYSGINDASSKLEYCYTKKPSGTPSCKKTGSWYHLTYYGAIGEYKYADGNHMVSTIDGGGNHIYYGSINKGNAEMNGQKVSAAWRICDNVGNCTDSGNMWYEYYFNGNRSC